MNEEEQQQTEVTILGPGQILRQAREKAQLTTQDIADKIRLKKALIEDIEQDNYDIKLSLTFVKGYLKLYAKHVDVLESEVMAAFDNLNTQDKEPAKLQSFSRRLANQANDDKLMLVTYLIVAAVIALVVVWWLQQGSTETSQVSELESYSSAPETVTDSAPVTEDIVPEVSTNIPKVEQLDDKAVYSEDSVESEADLNFSRPTPDSSVDSESVIANPESAESQELVQSEITNTEASAESLTQVTAEPVELVFEFSGDCWMNLTDATGENIAYGVKVKGRVMPVTGIPPFVVTLGAPEVVQIRYAGEALDMSFLTPGRIAKFDLPLSE